MLDGHVAHSLFAGFSGKHCVVDLADGFAYLKIHNHSVR